MDLQIGADPLSDGRREKGGRFESVNFDRTELDEDQLNCRTNPGTKSPNSPSPVSSAAAAAAAASSPPVKARTTKERGSLGKGATPMTRKMLTTVTGRRLHHYCHRQKLFTTTSSLQLPYSSSHPNGGDSLDELVKSILDTLEDPKANPAPALVSSLLPHIEDDPHPLLCRLDPSTFSASAAILATLPYPSPLLRFLQRALFSSPSPSTSSFPPTPALFRDLAAAQLTLWPHLQRVSILDLLIKVCSCSGSPDLALHAFSLANRITPRIDSCNALLSSLMRSGRTVDAWNLFDEMRRRRFRFNIVTYNIMINLLCKEGKVRKAEELVAYMEKNRFAPDASTYNAVIRGYFSRGKPRAAMRMLDKMGASSVEPDGCTYGTIISGLCKEGKLEEASSTLEGMPPGLATAFAYNSIISGYCNRGKIDVAFRYKEAMEASGITTSVVTYNTLLHAMSVEGKGITDLEALMAEMKEKGVAPDAITYNVLINRCSQTGDVNGCFRLYDEMRRKGGPLEPNNVTYTSLIYALCRSKKRKDGVAEAEKLFGEARSRGVAPDTAMFNALIDGNCGIGKMDRAFELLGDMEGRKVAPDDVTYNTLLKGLCLLGKVDEARELIDEMRRKGLTPDRVTYNTLISGYRRKGCMKGALDARDEMLRCGFDPNILTYNALVRGLSESGDLDLAQELLAEMEEKGIVPDENTYLGFVGNHPGK